MKPFSAIGTILVTAGLITAAPAGAQTKEQKAGARAAADAGADAFDAGKYAEAADLFERAERLVHAPPHLLYAARSHAKLGHFVEARELYLTLTRERLADSAPRVFRDAQQMGEKELNEVESRLAYVSVVVQGGAGATSVRVTRNGEDVPPELLGVPTPVNPGDYSYQALADGMESTATTIKLREGVRDTVLLTLRDIPGASKKKPTAPGAAPAEGEASNGSLLSAPSTDSAASGGGRPLLVGSIAGFGVAVAGGVLGTLFLSKSNDTADKSDALFAQCQVTGCAKGSPRALEIEGLDDDATSQRGVAIAGFVVGGVGLAAGVTLLILDQNRSTTVAGARVTPVIGTNYLGIAGRF
ncbi:MAG: hypothetical protein EOO73_09050 [Myxococcales bacterium]|nr:MAG: hypothetical protein EOO73_09050 [Myxococcales bacterium]